MNKWLTTLFSLFCFPVILCGQAILWEELSAEVQRDFIALHDTDSLAVMIYEGVTDLHDSPELWEMLDNIIRNNQDQQEIDPFDFYVFNSVCSVADGALSDGLGKYCITFCQSFPIQVIKLFNTKPNYIKVYSDLIGYEIAQSAISRKDINWKVWKIKSQMYKRRNKSDKYAVREFCKNIKRVARNARL